MNTPAKKYTLEEASQIIHKTLQNVDGMHLVRGIGTHTNIDGECKFQALLVPESRKHLYKIY